MSNGRTPAQVLFTIMIACGLWAGTASAQDVSRLCDGYARQAVQQNKQNAEFGCGLSGPQWNSDYRYHYDWCVQGRNSESAARWNQWRDGQIAQCRTAKPEKPKAPARKPSKWDQTVRARLPDLVRHLDQKTSVQANNIARAQEQWAQQRAGAVRKAADLRTGPTDAENVKRIDQAAAEFRRRPGTVAPQIPGSVLQARPPQITAFVVEPIKGVVEPQSAILIGGLNFSNQPGRNQPGKVHLRYADSPPPWADIGYKPKTYDVELKPLKKTWQDSWTESLIFIRVPDTLPGEHFYTSRAGQVVITFADGVSIKRDVTVSAGNPVITEVATSSGNAGSCCLTTVREEWRRLSGTTSYVLQPIEFKLPDDTDRIYGRVRHWVQPGDTIVIIGRFFGSAPGKARLDLSRKIGGLSTVQLTTIKPDDWSDTKISLRAEFFPIRFYVEMQRATLVLQTASGRELVYGHFAFGPEMQVKVVSGFKWLEQSRQQYAHPTPNGTAMLVIHTPDCGTFADYGEKGWDPFSFPPTFLPHEFYDAMIRGSTGAKVIQVNFKQIDPENPYNDLDFFIDMAGDLANELLKYGPAGLITYCAKKVFQAIGLAGEGAYYAYVASVGNQGCSINWETSCELADAKPVIYTISFIVIGPKEVLDKF